MPLPYHADASNPLQARGHFAGSLRTYWRTLRDVDAVWLLGPYPLSLAYVLLALLSRKRVVLGVRQDMPQYIRNRRPGKRWIHLAGDLLEQALPAPGSQASRSWSWDPSSRATMPAAPRLLEISVSLVRDHDIVDPGAARALIRRRAADRQRRPAGPGEEPAHAGGGDRPPARAGSALEARGLRRRAAGGGPRAPPGRAGRRVGGRAQGHVPIDDGLSASTATGTSSCTSPGPKGCRRCCWRRWPPRCRWSRRPSAASPRRSATARC